MAMLSREEVERIARKHFGDLGNVAVATATAIAFAESGGYSDAVNDNYPRFQASTTSPYRYDFGLMQINSVHAYDMQRLIQDPDYNMECARAIFNKQGWEAWTTFKAGSHLAHYIPLSTPDVYTDIAAERKRAYELHSPNGKDVESLHFANPRWLPILTEELGEVARVLCDGESKERLREELIQVAAMASAWADACDRG